MKIDNYIFSVGRGYSNIIEHSAGWVYGEVVTQYGIVTVYAQGDNRHVYITRLDIALNGKCYIRSFDKRYSPRGIATKAKQFAKEIADG